MTITAQGYEALRASDWLRLLRSDVEAFVLEEYEQNIDWQEDLLLNGLVAIVAQRLGQLSELSKAIYDATDPNNASGAQLDALASMLRVYRQAPTASVAQLTLSGVSGTVVPAGKQAFGNNVLWTLLEDVTIPGKGQAVCAVTGPIEAAIGEIVTIASPVVGWSGVTNLRAAIPGQDAESDADLRLRRDTRLRAADGRSLDAVRTALLALDFVESALVIDNPDAEPAVVRGETMPGCSMLAVVYPDPATDERRTELAIALYKAAPFGIELVGDEAADVIGVDLNPKEVRWSVATEVVIPIDFVVTLYTGAALVDVTADITAAVDAYLLSLRPGDPISTVPLFGIVSSLGTVFSAEITIDGAAAYVPAATQVVRATVTVTG